MIRDGLLVVAHFRLAQFRHVGHNAERARNIAADGAEFGFHDQHVHHLAVAAQEGQGDLDGSTCRAFLLLAVFVKGAVLECDQMRKGASDHVGALIAGCEQPIVADGGDLVCGVQREQHGGCQVVDFRRLLVGALQFAFLTLEQCLHFVEAFGEAPHLVGRAPVDVVAGAEAACCFDGGR